MPGTINRSQDTKGKAKTSQNAYKHGISKLQKEIIRLLKEHKQAIERVS